MSAFRRFFARFRRFFAFLALIGAVFFVGREILPQLPRETEVELIVGPKHADFVKLDVAYRRRGEALKGAQFHYRDGAPERIRHTVDLPPGRYEVRLELTRRDGGRVLRRGALEAPADGVVRVGGE